MSERQFVFRWDVDHRVCITDGIPRIRATCRDFGVPNTFFVNLGRSTNLREWLGKGVARSRAKLADKDAVHLIQKTGWPRFLLETAVHTAWDRPGVSRVIVNTNSRDYYEFRTQPYCADRIDWENRIALRSRSGSFICSGYDAEIYVPEAMGAAYCPLFDMRKLTPAEVTALRSQRR